MSTGACVTKRFQKAAQKPALPGTCRHAGVAPGEPPASVCMTGRLWCAHRRFAKLEQPASSAEGERATRLCRTYPYLSECEALVALSLCDHVEERAERRLRNFSFVMRVRKVRAGETACGVTLVACADAVAAEAGGLPEVPSAVRVERRV